MKKKLVFGLLSCIMAVSCLTGCNNEADATASSTEVPVKTEEASDAKKSAATTPAGSSAPTVTPQSE